MNGPVRRRGQGAAALLVALTACAGGDGPADEAAIAAADAAYAAAWLANDSVAVMATLTPDAVIVPSGRSALATPAAIRGFWWPEGGAATAVRRFDLRQEEVGGSGNLGFARGSFTLAFDYDGQSYESGGEYVSLLRKGPDGRWRISHRWWSDRPR
ncbi:MAG: DUF4440 domain-containing protein [Gemmatimonadota bacterium]